MKCSNCDKELTEDITGSNSLMRTYKCVCLRLESFYEIEGPEWLLRLASNVCYRLDNDKANEFKPRFKELVKSIKNEEELKVSLVQAIQSYAGDVLHGLIEKQYYQVIKLLHQGVLPIGDEIRDAWNLGHSLAEYAEMWTTHPGGKPREEPADVKTHAWGVEYGSYGNKKSYEQSAIKYADLIIEVMENANDSIS